MHIFFGDETNKSSSDGEFFVYGGLILSDAQIVWVHDRVRGYREHYGLGVEDKIKFTGHAMPDHLDKEHWRELKSGILDILVECDATFMAYYVHHDIIKNQTQQIRNQWAIEPILYRYQMYLTESESHGFAILDNIEEAELRRLEITRINTEGLKFEPDGDPVPLDRIVGIARAHVDWSHCLSANDVVLGAFGYSINHPGHEVANDMMRRVNRMFWHDEMDGVRYMGERGLIRRPKGNIEVAEIRERYQRIEEHLDRLLNV